MNDNPLISFTLRLHLGIDRLNVSLREKIRSFILSRQDSSGGFVGRRGKADIYYTSFALRALSLLGPENSPILIKSIEGFIDQFLFDLQKKPRDLSSAELHSLLFSVLFLEGMSGTDPLARSLIDRKTFFVNALMKLRRQDGGFAASTKDTFSGIYHTFLAIISLRLLEIPISEKIRSEILDLLRKNQREEGGFSEMEKLRSAGTNPTAAAIMIVRAISGSDEIDLGSARAFLWSMQGAEGGFRANTRIPIADLLSTFTVLTALWDPSNENFLSLFQERKIRHFVESLQTKEGGFRAAFWDQEPDIEYTFYGLALLSLLNRDHTGILDGLET